MPPVREVDVGRDFSFFFLLEKVKLEVTITGLLVACPLCFPSADKSPLRCMIVFKSSILLPVIVVIGVCFYDLFKEATRLLWWCWASFILPADAELVYYGV